MLYCVMLCYISCVDCCNCCSGAEMRDIVSSAVSTWKSSINSIIIITVRTRSSRWPQHNNSRLIRWQDISRCPARAWRLVWPGVEAGAEPRVAADHQLDAALLPRGRDDVAHVLVSAAAERGAGPLQHLVPGQQVARQVRHAALLHLHTAALEVGLLALSQ